MGRGKLPNPRGVDEGRDHGMMRARGVPELRALSAGSGSRAGRTGFRGLHGDARARADASAN